MSPVLLIGSAVPEVDEIRRGLEANLEEVPMLSGVEGTDPFDWPWADELDRWRDQAGGRTLVDHVAVAPWPAEVGEPDRLASLPSEEWLVRAEVSFARWFAAMGVAAQRCRDGGAIVAIVERPPPLDCAGWAAETGTADAVESMVRSLARAQGRRSVRVNAVTTPVRLHRPPVVDPPPSLLTFPGSVATEVLGAVSLLLSPGASGITGTAVHADCGRSWR